MSPAPQNTRAQRNAALARSSSSTADIIKVCYWHKAGNYGLNTAPLGFNAVVDRQFQEGLTMSFRILGSIVGVSLFALTIVTHAQNAPQTTFNSTIKVAQAATQPGSAEVTAKTSKSKVKKAKGGKGTGSGGPESRPSAPSGGSGPPDPGVYK